ncbi:MAG: asparaginase [Acidobacteria bacterium]|nr:asparaginase [Acidobacteriota bacterium]
MDARHPRPRILLLHTGGTFGMAPADPHHSLAPGPALERILEQVPELKELADLRLEIPFNRDSSELEPEHILLLARTVRERAPDYQGIVIIHGTDTMAFTASVLGFLLADLGKPVVLTGSQRPLAFVRGDARKNLIDAVDLATTGVPEVGICFGDFWYRGVASEKLSVTRYRAFGSPNLPPLAEIGMKVQLYPHAGQFERRVPPGLGTALEGAIAVHSPHPGMPWALPPEGIRGLLILAYGAGNLPMERQDLAALLDRAKERRLPVVVLSQCTWGGVEFGTYDLSRKLAATGAISGGLHTRWAALAKLGLCLGSGWDLAAIREAFAVSWAGEPV